MTWRQENWKIHKSFVKRFESYFYHHSTSLKLFFQFLRKYWPSRYVLAFKRLAWSLDSQIDLFGSMIIMYEFYESNLDYFDVLFCNLGFLAKDVAFLALTTLKLQNTDITWLEIPNGPNDKEKSLIFCTQALWRSKWPLRPSLALFKFFSLFDVFWGH